MLKDSEPAGASAAERAPGDPAPYEIVNPDGRARVLLLCDHASAALPARAAGLGLPPELLARHIAWDIGAAETTRRLSALMDAPAVLSGASRLYIDVNRSPSNPSSILGVSDGIEVPGNRNLTTVERECRIADYFTPYHRAAEDLGDKIAARAGLPAFVTVHSFTPVMDGFERPWHIGILWHRDPRLAAPLLAELGARPALVVGDNQPYSGSDPESYSLATHGAAHGRPHVEFEIRQDLIDTHHGVEAWAEVLAGALRTVLADGELFREAYF